ncbi:YybH family protein [Janthinobacterium fluminis]|uniref:SgcJ/EcaC family oxidoreductase n=1 Tax=Janthinobacterium fluminis TaxID=2987524 RepID=A0ABT5JXJ7_9BURK|nr:SgcJ/EcaC family oxidoreductase [Janthinobacterium fluminis]MDC8757155.1 SgcJ/EcaC family oxidoreductase [Janthinobacterium fluminis]
MSQDERAIRQLIATWLRASRDGDIEQVLALMAPDVLFLVPGQEPMLGRETFADGLRGLLRTQRIEADSEVEEVVVAGDMAYCRTRLSVRIVPAQGGAATQRAGHTLSILRKGADGAWRLTRDANLLMPVETPGV